MSYFSFMMVCAVIQPPYWFYRLYFASGSSVQASFSSSFNVIGCDSVVVDLNNTSSGGSVYAWTVYDGFQNVVHTSSSENTSFTYDVNGVNTANVLYIYYEVSSILQDVHRMPMKPFF